MLPIDPAVLPAPTAHAEIAAPSSRVTTLRLDVRRPGPRVRPDEALGWSLDGGETGASAPLFDIRNRAKLRRLTRAPISYRLRTELAGEVWHWSAYGRWSDPAGRQGYWVGDARRRDPAKVSYGYRLPRRGNSRDEANDDGYSRLDDGDPASFWKSNPYLAEPYVKPGRERPEWIKLDLGAEQPVDGLEMVWRDPFARRLRVQFWQGGDPWTGRWVTFPAGEVTVEHSGVLSLRLGSAPRPVRFVRLLMDRPSLTAPAGATDARDSRGYAVAEIRLGTWRGSELADAIRHAPDGRLQTQIHVSSTDPWHREGDRDPNVEQPSLLALRDIGLLSPERLMLPVSVLYDTPENTAAELAYFRRFGLRPREVELGEEPEGQRADPETFAELYVQRARAVAAAWPGVRVVGPSLINHVADTWLDDDPERSWTRRMLAAVRERGGAGLFRGFTLEHYPDDDLCTDAGLRLRREPQNMERLFARLAGDTVPADMPVTLTEFGQSAYTGETDVDLASAPFTAQVAAEFLSRGGRAAYLYSLTPGRPAPGSKPCAGAGDMMSYELDRADVARWAMPQLRALRLVSEIWLGRDARLFTPMPTGSEAAAAPVRAYAARRVGGAWSVLLINRSRRPQVVRLAFVGRGPQAKRHSDAWSYGADQYRWSTQAQHPLRDRPPVRSAARSWDAPLNLPPWSLTVLRDR